MEEENIHHANHGYPLHGGRICSVFLSKIVKGPMKTGSLVRPSIIFFFLLIGAFISLHWIDVVPLAISDISLQKTIPSSNSLVGINCSITCPIHSSTTIKSDESPSSEVCPEYFRWIYQDLNPWKEKGITKEMVESAGSEAYMRIVVVNGKVYIKKLKRAFQTRDVFNIWGILQLLRLYPGKLPDLDIMFECGDRPVIQKRDYGGSNANNVTPMFHYCASDSTLDIVFPDWSFWGWPELHIKPWEALTKDLEAGNQRVKWIDRIPYAHWKGSPRSSLARKELLKCNLTDQQDWGALIYALNWGLERREMYKSTDLANQCTHRYKVYVEGRAWSVSEKYILACDSMSLLVTPHYYDFFTRSLLPSIHYWPIKENDICRSIKSAVNWGNKHPEKVQEIGKAGSKFIQEELKMKSVYDYMFHLLYQYGQLLKYKPTVPEGSIEVCLETMACSGTELEKTFKMNSMGFFGEVFRGIWNGTDVAIKVFLEQDLTIENIEDFCNEISTLSRLRHPNGKAYYAVEEVEENATQKSQKVFVHVPSEIAAHDVHKLLFCCLILLLSSVLFLTVTARSLIFEAFNCNNEGCQG